MLKQEPVYAMQDLGRLGRDMSRTVLVDDTPLAFLRQPDNGIPIFNFRYVPRAHWQLVCLLPRISLCHRADSNKS